MKKLFVLFLTLVLALSLSSVAFAAGKLTVTQEVFYVRPFLTYHAGEVYAQVTNTGDKPVAFNGGLVELYNADGDSIESSNLYSCYPEVLAPGESGYLYVTKSVDEATDASYIDDYLLTVTGKGENDKQTIRMESTGVFEEYQRSKYWVEQAMFATVTNNTDALQRGVRVVFAAFDAEDTLLYADSTELYSLGIPPESTVEVRVTVDSRIMDAWKAEGITPARIETIAYVEVEP